MALKYSQRGAIAVTRMLDLDSYLKRIGYAGSCNPTLETLRALQVQHPLAIPFENLDTLSGRPVRLDLGSLERKLVQSRRGGYCFEQNVLFKHALGALGFRVTALAARVVWERPAGEMRARTHMVLLVETDGVPYICDVGFGALTPTAPVALTPDVEQATPHETFRVVRVASEFAVEALVRGEWKRLYRFDLQEQLEVDIELLNHYVTSHADSPMRGRLIAARVAADRRFGLGNGVFKVHPRNAATEQRQLGSVAELKSVLAATFGVEVPSGSEIDAELARVLAAE
jgi:N-hydroxyarylamine O-acetyltransferase